eukprot:scaffold733_cov267-Pinguiococcus_pyrenoidosus.AAC.23
MHPRVGDEGRPGFALSFAATRRSARARISSDMPTHVLTSTAGLHSQTPGDPIARLSALDGNLVARSVAARTEAKVCDRRPGTPAHPRELLNSCPEPWLPGGRDAAPRGRPVSNSPRGCAIASGNQRRFPHLAGIETNCRKTRRHASQRRPASFGIIVGERRDVLGILKFLDLDTAQQRISKVGQRPSFGKMFQASYFRRMFCGNRSIRQGSSRLFKEDPRDARSSRRKILATEDPRDASPCWSIRSGQKTVGGSDALAPLDGGLDACLQATANTTKTAESAQRDEVDVMRMLQRLRNTMQRRGQKDQKQVRRSAYLSTCGSRSSSPHTHKEMASTHLRKDIC